MERFSVDGRARDARLAARTIVDLRGAPGIVAANARWAVADISRAGGSADSLREEIGLHAHRIDANHGASAGCFVGLSDDWLLRGYEPIRNAGRFHVFRGPVPPGGDWSHSGLDARPFPARCARAGLFRWYTSLRARGLATRGAT